MAKNMQADWQDLYMYSMEKDFFVQKPKERFADQTKYEVADFKKVCEEFARRFREEGPASAGQDLEKGAHLMDVCIL